MKRLFLSFCLLTILSVILSACGPAKPPQTTRQQQLSETNLFGRHIIDGVSVDEGISGQIHGGFFLFAAGMNGSISSTTNYTIQWQPTAGDTIWSTLPRSIFKRVIDESLNQPEMEIVFKESWLAGHPYNHFGEKDRDGRYIDIKTDEFDNYYYTNGAKLNLNNFIQPDNIDIVYIYIATKDLQPPTGVQIP